MIRIKQVDGKFEVTSLARASNGSNIFVWSMSNLNFDQTIQVLKDQTLDEQDVGDAVMLLQYTKVPVIFGHDGKLESSILEGKA